MLRWVIDVWEIKELRQKLLYTLGILIIYVIGTHIPLPGINTVALEEFFKQFDHRSHDFTGPVATLEVL